MKYLQTFFSWFIAAIEWFDKNIVEPADKIAQQRKGARP